MFISAITTKLRDTEIEHGVQTVESAKHKHTDHHKNVSPGSPSGIRHYSLSRALGIGSHFNWDGDGFRRHYPTREFCDKYSIMMDISRLNLPRIFFTVRSPTLMTLRQANCHTPTLTEPWRGSIIIRGLIVLITVGMLTFRCERESHPPAEWAKPTRR